jgi:RluA family pseudouridine synthase
MVPYTTRVKTPTGRILYRDEHFVALDKPSGLASVRERWTDDESAFVLVHRMLREADPEARKPRVVHRLDKETSGVILFATSLEAARSLSRQFREREVEKTYQGIVQGTPPDEEGEVTLELDEDRSRPGRVRVVRHGGKSSLTLWRRREAFAGYALLDLRPRTGRTHQLRVSLEYLGYPLLGDPEYGGREGLFLSELKRRYKAKRGLEERPIIGRVALHAASIDLVHPITGERVTITAEPPKDFLLALKYLRKYRPLRRPAPSPTEAPPPEPLPPEVPPGSV